MLRQKITAIIFSLFLGLNGCIPTRTAQPTYTIDPLLLQTLEAIRVSPTPSDTPTSTSTVTLTPTLDGTQKAAISSLTALKKTQLVTENKTPSGSPTKTPKPTKTPLPTKTKKPSFTPTPPGPTATAAPQDAPIRIFSPASFSRINSPIKLVMNVVPGSKGNVYLQLIGEQSQLLFDKKWSFPNANGKRTVITEEINFAIESVAEAANLKVFTYDEYGRLMNLASEDIILLSIGKEDLAEPENLMSPFALIRPYPDQVIKDGLIIINGMTRCRTDCRLYFEVVDTTGKQLAVFEQQNIIQASLDYQPIYFEIPVDVTLTTPVRLIMHQQDIFSREDIAVSSILLKLIR